MVQFNLLPDVKIEYIKTRYRKRLIMVVCAAVSAVTLVIFVILALLVFGQQKHHIGNLDKDIKARTNEIKNTNDLDKILTIQNQLNTLPGLHDKKVDASRLVPFLGKVTPAEATISGVEIDFTANTMSVKGNAPSLAVVNKYIDTLKYTTYKVNGSSVVGAPETGKAFKNVVMTTFSVPNGTAGAGASAQSSYSISLEFEPVLFTKVKDDTSNGTEPIVLVVPAITSSGSETQKPALFQAAPVRQEGDQ